MSQKTLIVLSGGLDSTVLCYALKAEKKAIRAIYFDIGYLPRIPERNAAKMVCSVLDIPLEIVDVSGIFSMVSGFVPIEMLGMGELDKGQPTPIALDEKDADYVSGFHSILSLASYYAMLARIDTIAVGILKEQVDFNPGLAEFLQAYPSIIELLNPKRAFALEAPFASKPKADVIKIGFELNVPLDRTWSCYRPGPEHCGTCSGCKSRQDAFEQAGIKDETRYAAKTS